MTREEEIMQEANTRYSVSHPFIDIAKESFIEGAHWADKKTINKAIGILIDLANDGCLIDIHNHEEFEKQFRKIMEVKV